MKSLSRLAAGSLVVLVVVAAGCDTQTLVGRQPTITNPTVDADGQQPDAGAPPSPDEVQPGPSSDAAAVDVPDARPSPPADPAFSIPDALVGTWTGYFQASKLQSGSDVLTLKLLREPGRPDRVTLTLGEGPPLVTTGSDAIWGAVPRKEGAPPDYFERFAYTGHQVLWRGQRLTFAIEAREPFEDWCAMQKPYPAMSAPAGYSCLPGGGTRGGSISFGPDGMTTECRGNDVPVDCKLYMPCITGMCACNAAGCSAGIGYLINFDVTFEPPVLGAWSLTKGTFRLQLAPADAGVAGAGD